MQYLRWLLLPFSVVYGFVVTIRNWLYDAGFFKSRAFDMPVICVGNLEVGGAGKSPMTEHLIALLKDGNKVATLSRGYGRETKGFLEASITSAASQVGDEPLQFKRKFPDVTVAVCEKRVMGIEKLQQKHDVIIMDDAYQHRAVKAGLNILLFDYTNLQKPQFVLPAGNMREPFSGRWRADVMVVTKCPTTINESDMTRCYNKLTPLSTQPLFFSSIAYQPLKALKGDDQQVEIDEDTTVFLLTGIANTAPLLSYIRTFTSHIIHHKYPDHHRFTTKNITKLADDFEACISAKKLVITTEKDAQRLTHDELKGLLVYVQPIGVKFLNQAQPQFDKIITDYVRQY
ncbi:tetraacyldisaccharide 4'-kinase [Mucilaginibacter achroorhodeus]|uniref:Tetraacyldisaccharide 4'-kinase n=1 Tax=Mucilaginibacter achroorhodeus TaxID=2599294 RepID=A0A563U1Y2_9SPHI|nr:tetraacyldisaccharide 4'-kinase [Mucilaginibacter achroorhodeus]TWR24539.1 tetraacyldisaccharide 4'-kinase [Mucilaginibacter achroorhodeus]